MNDLCDLLGTPDAPVSKIASVNSFIYLPKYLLLKGLQVQKQSIKEFEFTDFCKTIWSKLVLYIYIQVIFRTNQSSYLGAIDERMSTFDKE